MTLIRFMRWLSVGLAQVCCAAVSAGDDTVGDIIRHSDIDMVSCVPVHPAK